MYFLNPTYYWIAILLSNTYDQNLRGFNVFEQFITLQISTGEHFGFMNFTNSDVKYVPAKINPIYLPSSFLLNWIDSMFVSIHLNPITLDTNIEFWVESRSSSFIIVIYGWFDINYTFMFSYKRDCRYGR